MPSLNGDINGFDVKLIKNFNELDAKKDALCYNDGLSKLGSYLKLEVMKQFSSKTFTEMLSVFVIYFQVKQRIIITLFKDKKGELFQS